jgi:hypothetical protein
MECEDSEGVSGELEVGGEELNEVTGGWTRRAA